MVDDDEEGRQLQSVALQNARSILLARERAERDLIEKTEELAHQREWFRVTLASIGDAVITTDVAGRVTFLNPIAEAMTGWTSADAMGQPLDAVFQIVNEDTRERAANPVDRVLREGVIVGLANHTALISRQGSETAIEDSAAPIRDADGDVAGAVMVFHDVTERRRAERALHEERRVLEILNVTGAAIAAHLDLDVLVQTVTDAGRELTGAKFAAFFYNVTDASGESFLLYSLSGAPREAFSKFGLPRNTPVFEPTFRGEGVVRSGDITRDERYGTMAPHHGMPKGHLPVRSYLAVPVVARSGEVIGGLFFGHPEPDVFTERAERLIEGIASQAAVGIDNARLYEAAQQELRNRERAEEALRETDRRKDEFLATLAHELRNPLAPIRQAALIANTATATEAQKRWSYGVIDRQVQHMSLLLDDLLDISRFQRGNLELRKQSAELAGIIDAAVETARPAMDAKQHTLVIDMPPEPVHFEADPVRLAQVLSNLLTNAAKYTDAEGRIRLTTRCTADSVVIAVADNGIGISPEALPSIFRMFSQIETTRDRSEGGLGIGLALSRAVIELHGGTIEGRSAGLGRGSEFTVRLPFVAPANAGLQRRTSASVAEASPRRKVLIADDNHDAAESLAMLLGLDGHEVIVANDGATALAIFTEFRPEFALLDIGMPGLDGYEVARRMRREAQGAALTLIAVTGWGQDSDKAEARLAGFNHHFTKPLDPDRLRRILKG